MRVSLVLASPLVATAIVAIASVPAVARASFRSRLALKTTRGRTSCSSRWVRDENRPSPQEHHVRKG